MKQEQKPDESHLQSVGFITQKKYPLDKNKRELACLLVNTNTPVQANAFLPCGPSNHRPQTH